MMRNEQIHSNFVFVKLLGKKFSKKLWLIYLDFVAFKHLLCHARNDFSCYAVTENTINDYYICSLWIYLHSFFQSWCISVFSLSVPFLIHICKIFLDFSGFKKKITRAVHKCTNKIFAKKFKGFFSEMMKSLRRPFRENEAGLPKSKIVDKTLLRKVLRCKTKLS